MDQLLWLIGLYILYSLFAKKRDAKPPANDPRDLFPGLDRRRRPASRSFPTPTAGLPAGRPELPARPQPAGETASFPSQFPWSFPELFEEDPFLEPEEADRAADTAVAGGWDPVLAEPAAGEIASAGLTPGLAPDLPQVETAVGIIRPETGWSSRGAMLKFTPAGVAGGIIWSEILQAPRSRRPFQWRRNPVKRTGSAGQGEDHGS